MNCSFMKNRFIVSILLVNVLLQSCKKFVTIEAPQNQLEVSKIFTDDQAAVSAAIGLYYRMNLSSLTVANSGVTVYAGLSADEFYNVSPDLELDQFRTNALIPDNGTGVYSNLWKASYQAIYHANAVLEGLGNSSSVSKTVKDQLRGEMLIGRAFHYFYLVNLFGDVPLITTTNYTVNTALPRTAADSVYQQLIADLSEAESLLSEQYPSGEKARPNKYTATALLARIFLYQNNWQKALEKASDVINSGLYTLETDLTRTFLSGSNETVWQIKPGTTYMNTAEGVEFNPYDNFTVPKYSLTSSLFSQFDSGDQRKIIWVSSNNAAGQDVYYPHKYKVGFSSVLTEYYVMLRLSEIYLIRAEASANLNNLAQARSDINQIRNKAGLTNTTANIKDSLLSSIEKENRLEFFAEWGHRWLDLKRTNRANAVLSVEKGVSWQPTDVLYPIPLGQLQINPSLIQNSGY